MYSIAFNISEADYVEFNKYHNFSNLSSQKSMGIVKILAPTMVGIILLLNLFVFDEPRFWFPLQVGIIATIVFYSIKPLTNLIIKSQIKSLKKQGKLPYNKHVQLYFDDEHYTEIGEITEVKIRYNVLEKVVEGPNAIYLYMGAMQATIIPHSAFENEYQRHNLLAFINSKVGYYKQ